MKKYCTICGQEVQEVKIQTGHYIEYGIEEKTGARIPICMHTYEYDVSKCCNGLITEDKDFHILSASPQLKPIKE